MKKTVLIVSIFFIVMSLSSFAYAKDPNILSESAILIDARTGQVLYEKNAHNIMYPASTTKVMTGILTLEKGNLDEMITVDDKTPYEITGSHIALEPGEVLSLKDILYALMIDSANDAATVAAKHIGGSVEGFAELMNEKAKEVGAKNTNFVNPHGLTHENHVTTAYDLAMIARYAMQNEAFREIVGGYTYSIGPTNKKNVTRYLKSNNRLLYSSEKINVNGKSVPIKYEGATGVKTGYTIAAQNCLISSAERDGLELIAVVLKASGREVYVDTHSLLDYGFENFTITQLSFENEFIKSIQVDQGDRSYVTAIVKDSIHSIVPKDRVKDIVKSVTIPDKLKAPISQNQVLGKIEYKLDDEVIGAADIISTADIAQKHIYQVIDSTTNSFVVRNWWVWILVLFLGWRTFIMFKRFQRRKKRRYAFASSKSRNIF